MTWTPHVRMIQSYKFWAHFGAHLHNDLLGAHLHNDLLGDLWCSANVGCERERLQCNAGLSICLSFLSHIQRSCECILLLL